LFRFNHPVTSPAILVPNLRKGNFTEWTAIVSDMSPIINAIEAETMRTTLLLLVGMKSGRIFNVVATYGTDR